MIPIRLSLEGLYSYQQKQEIDFARLTAAELFGIFGATGSGKSSILEAIGFALYGKTERLSAREPGGTAYHMMNLKRDRLAIDFEFWAGPGNGTRYRFAVDNKRNSRQYDKTGSFTRRAFCWTGQDWEPIDEGSAEQVLGLSYENFRRCIIIPQGKFEEFLQLGTTERSNMLMELFDLAKYDLGKQVARLRQQTNFDIENTRGKLAAYEAVTQEAMQENAAAMATLEAQRTEVESRLRQRQREQEQAQQLRELVERLDRQRQQLRQLEQERPAHDARKQRLDHYQQAQLTFGTPLSEFDQQTRRSQDTLKALEAKQASLTTIDAELSAKQKTFEETDALFQTRDQLLRRAEELEKVLHLQRLTSVMADRQQQTEKGKREVDELERSVRELEQQQAQAEEAIHQLEESRPNMSRLMEVKTWYQEQKTLADKIKREDKAHEQVRSRIARGKAEKRSLAAKIGIDLSQHDLPLTKLIAEVEQQQTAYEARRAQLDAQLRQAEIQAKLHQLAGDLAPGDPCPLCGATDHPALRHHNAEDEHLASLKLDLAAVDRHIQEIQRHLPALHKLREDARELAQELKDLEDTRSELSRAWDLHLSRFVWSEYEQEGEARIEAQVRAGEDLDRQIAAQKSARLSQRDTIRLQRQKLQDYRPRLEQLQQELGNLRGELASGVKGLSRVSWPEYERYSELNIQREMTRLRKDYEGVSAMHQTLQTDIQERKDRMARLKGEISTLQRQQQEHTAELARLSQQLEKLLLHSPFESREEVRTVLAQALDLEAEREEIRRFEREETQTSTTIRDLEAQVQERSFDPEAFDKLQKDIRELEAQQSRLTQEIGGKRELGIRMEADYAQKLSLGAELERLALRAENLSTLEGLFRGNGFVNYISTVYLENLCAAANERFLKLTRNSLSLEIDAENHFLVRDHLNGGRTRSVKTLSGGQTFQAALCLALALSDQVQRQAQAPQNFFFLDEGFGSQDRQSLGTIFQTLKSLRHENRIVGVISHVEELQQEIETHLRIVNDPELGSQVWPSWREAG